MANHNRIGDDAHPTEFEFIVVGSGAGGATVAEALARQGRAVLILERGQPEEKLGTTRQTSLPGLFVCDASVLPAPPGLPPIVTIAALARRLATHLAQA